MNAQTVKCLVTLLRANILQSVIVECGEDEHGKFLLIPIADFFIKGLEGAEFLKLCVPEGWLIYVETDSYELRCREVIDLDTCDVRRQAAPMASSEQAGGG